MDGSHHYQPTESLAILQHIVISALTCLKKNHRDIGSISMDLSSQSPHWGQYKTSVRLLHRHKNTFQKYSFDMKKLSETNLYSLSFTIWCLINVASPLINFQKCLTKKWSNFDAKSLISFQVMNLCLNFVVRTTSHAQTLILDLDSDPYGGQFQRSPP